MKQSSPWKVWQGAFAVLIATASGVFYYLGGTDLFKRYEFPAPHVTDPAVAAAQAEAKADQEARDEQAKQQLRDQMEQALIDDKISRDKYNAEMTKLEADKQYETEKAAEAQLQQRQEVLASQDQSFQQDPSTGQQQILTAPQIITVNAPPAAPQAPVDATQQAQDIPQQQADTGFADQPSPPSITPWEKQGASQNPSQGLQFLPGPPNGPAVVIAAIQQMFNGKTSLLGAGAPAFLAQIGNINSLQIKPLFVVYFLNAQYSAMNQGLDHATTDIELFESGDIAGFLFEYLIMNSGQPLATASVVCDVPGTPVTLKVGVPPPNNVGYPKEPGIAVRVFRMNTNGFAPAVATALTQLAANDQINAGSYQVRYIHDPKGDIAAIWLKSLTGKGDLLYPIQPGTTPLHAGLQTGMLYTYANFLSAVH